MGVSAVYYLYLIRRKNPFYFENFSHIFFAVPIVSLRGGSAMTMTVHLARLLVLAVIFVNGWTDAPNAIATAVGSGALTFRRGVWLAAACNFAGAALA